MKATWPSCWPCFEMRLPCPDLNPIELAFSKLKALLRAKAIRTAKALWKALGDLCDSFSPRECTNYFRHDGYFQSA